MKLRYYLMTELICLFGAMYFAFWQNGNPLGIGCLILALIVYTATQAKQLSQVGESQ